MTRRKHMQRARVLVTLLTGAGNLSAFRLSALAHVPVGRVSSMLSELERLGWVRYSPPDGSGDLGAYFLTPRGRERAISITALDLPTPGDVTVTRRR